MEITKQFLLEKGWKLTNDSIPTTMHWIVYELIVTNSNGKFFSIEMRYDSSNTPNRDWGCHIDNSLYESIAFVDIGTVEQFNKLMDLMDIEYRL